MMSQNGREIILPHPTSHCLLCNSVNLTDSNEVGAKTCNNCGSIPPFITECFCCNKAFLSSFTGRSPAEVAKLSAEWIFCSVACLEYHTAKKHEEEEAEKAARLREIELEKRDCMMVELEKKMKDLRNEKQQILNQGIEEEREMAREKESRKRLWEETPVEFAPEKAICIRPAQMGPEFLPEPTTFVQPTPIVQKPSKAKVKYPPRGFPGLQKIFTRKAVRARLAHLFEETSLVDFMDQVYPLSAKVYRGSALAFYTSMQPDLLETQFVGPVPMLGNVYIYFLKVVATGGKDFQQTMSKLNENHCKHDFLDLLKEHLMPYETREKRKGRKAQEDEDEEEEEDEYEEDEYEDEEDENNDHVLGQDWSENLAPEKVSAKESKNAPPTDEATLEGFPGGVPLEEIFAHEVVPGTVHLMFNL